MGIMQDILSAIQQGTTTPPGALAATQTLLGQIDPNGAQPPAAAPMVATAPPAMVPDGSTPVAAPHLQADGAPPPMPGDVAHPTMPGAPQRPMGVMSAIGHILAPEPGSFWHEALNHGLMNAREGMQGYVGGVQAAVDARKLQEQKIAQEAANTTKAQAEAARARFIVDPQGAVLEPNGNGGVTSVYTPPVKSSDQERMLTRVLAMPPGPDRDLAASMLRGYQYTAPVITAQGAVKKAVAAIHAAAHHGGAAKQAKPPGGFILQP